LQQEKLPEESRKKSNKDWNVSRHVYAHCTLLGISLIAMKEPWFTNSWLSAQLSGQSIILLLGGLFLIYKAPMK
jgi:hypothetical protein